MGHGTGFFVAPGLILTCAHVVKEVDGKPIQICWQSHNEFAVAAIERSFPELDIALLSFTPPPNSQLPCVYFDRAVEPGDGLYIFGYPDIDFPNGCPVTFTCEGLTGDEPPLIKFKLGQVRPGMSGSPLLNQRTKKVCGIVKFTRDRSIDLGGGAVPTSVIFSQFPELEQLNQQFHLEDKRWSNFLVSPKPQGQLAQKEYRNRQVLLSKVRNHWIKGVLDRSLYSRAKIELGLEEYFDAIYFSWETAEQSRQELPKRTRAINKFDELGAGRTLLILGEPGSGKTTMLLEIAQTLIERAEQDISLSIPVVFNLSSWSSEKRKIADWLVQELNIRYQVARKLGKNWIKDQQLLLLLDGLDEVKAELREACVQALNRFIQEYGQTEIIVCSRIKDYETLSNRLHVQGAIFVQPLTREQIENYLDRAGTELLGVKAALQNDPVLQELAQTPLMLSVMALAYQRVSAAELPQISLETQHQQVFDKYIERTLRQRRSDRHYSQERIIHWLSFLAQKMDRESQTIFLIEQVQPSWLSPGIQRWIYPIKVSLISGIVAEFVYGTVFGLTGDLLSVQMLLGLLMGLIFGGVSSLNLKIELIETIGWSWSWGRAWKAGTPALLGGPIIGLLISLGSFIGLPVRDWLSNLIVGGVGGLLAGLVMALVSALLGGLTRSDVEKKTFPNQGIWRSARRAGISTILSFILFVCPVVFLTKSLIPLQTLLGCITVFLSFISLSTGGLICIQHLTVRMILWCTNSMPWNYTHFLNYATERMVMQKVGGGYQFSHELLRKRLADKSDSGLPNPAKPKFIWNKLNLISTCLVSLSVVSLVIPLSIDAWLVDAALANIMTPRLEINDRIFIDKISPHFVEFKRGDIIAFKPTQAMKDQGFKYVQDVKQIIGLPGENIEIKEGKIYINGQTLKKDNMSIHLSFRNYSSMTIPNDSYFVIATNPEYSDNKSRFIGGLIPQSNIIGRLSFRYWPLHKVGQIE